MPRVHFVKKARKDHGSIKAGESYYWWKFRYGGRRVSRTRPSRSQLTQSEFLSQLWGLEDGWEWDGENLEGSVEELVGELNQMRDECEEKLMNMPEGLQESSDSGQLLQERIEGLEGWVGELESVDLEISDDNTLENIIENLDAANPGIG